MHARSALLVRVGIEDDVVDLRSWSNELVRLCRVRARWALCTLLAGGSTSIGVGMCLYTTPGSFEHASGIFHFFRCHFVCSIVFLYSGRSMYGDCVTPIADFAGWATDNTMATEEITYRCSLCGPNSLHGERSEPDCECHASRSGFKKSDRHLFLSCWGCGSKMSIECLNALAAKVNELDCPLHDPEGVWETLRARPWASDRYDDPPLQGWSIEWRCLLKCLLCEQGELPTAEPNPELDEIKELGADYDPAVAVAVSVKPVFADGRRTDEMGRVLHAVHLYPIVNPSDSEAFFKHGTGSLKETGCVPRPAPLATTPRPTARPRYPRCSPPLPSRSLPFNTPPTDLSTWAKPYPPPTGITLPPGTREWLPYSSTILIGEPHPRRPVTRRLASDMRACVSCVSCVHVHDAFACSSSGRSAYE